MAAIYVDHILEGERQMAASQIAQASAIISGLATFGEVLGLGYAGARLE
jgi:hypothetical protein